MYTFSILKKPQKLVHSTLWCTSTKFNPVTNTEIAPISFLPSEIKEYAGINPLWFCVSSLSLSHLSRTTAGHRVFF